VKQSDTTMQKTFRAQRLTFRRTRLESMIGGGVNDMETINESRNKKNKSKDTSEE
jgi:hypothetical protein